MEETLSGSCIITLLSPLPQHFPRYRHTTEQFQSTIVYYRHQLHTVNNYAQKPGFKNLNFPWSRANQSRVSSLYNSGLVPTPGIDISSSLYCVSQANRTVWKNHHHYWESVNFEAHCSLPYDVHTLNARIKPCMEYSHSVTTLSYQGQKVLCGVSRFHTLSVSAVLWLAVT